MHKFNYNLFKSNCNSLSKQFNQVHSTCVVYHDICQQSVAKPINTSNLDACSSSDSEEHTFQCQNQTCSDRETNSTTNSDCKTFSTNTNTHHHHHNHEHGLIYSKRVRSILLLNALLSKPSNEVKTTQTTYSPFLALGSKWQQIRNYAKKAGSKDKKKAGKSVNITEEELSECINADKFREDLDLVVANLKEDFISNINIRIGTNIELLQVNVDNETYVLKDIARLSKKNNLITIDLSELPEFSKSVMEAIRKSGMNVNPQQDGTKIYFQQIKSTKEHREALAKNCKTLLQKAKDNLKTVQNNYINRANLKKTEKVSQDIISNCCAYIRQATKEATDVCTDLYEQKVKQLIE